jgi:hypothetical protein
MWVGDLVVLDIFAKKNINSDGSKGEKNFFEYVQQGKPLLWYYII